MVRFLALGVISGAILSHLTKLGIAGRQFRWHVGRGLALRLWALVVFVGSVLVLLIHRREIPLVGRDCSLAARRP